MFYEDKQDGNLQKRDGKGTFSTKRQVGDVYKLSNGNEYIIPEEHKSLGLFIKRLREASGFGIEETVKRAAIPKSAYQLIESGDFRIRALYVMRAFQLFGYKWLPVLDFSDSSLIVNMDILPKRADFLLAAKMSKMAEKNPLFKKWSNQNKNLNKFFLRAQREYELRKTDSELKIKAIRKKYKLKINKLNDSQNVLLVYKPNSADQKTHQKVFQAFERKRAARNRYIRRAKMLGKEFFQNLKQ
jgi:transcriptional regulator with XRE-family HTH domain